MSSETQYLPHEHVWYTAHHTYDREVHHTTRKGISHTATREGAPSLGQGPIPGTSMHQKAAEGAFPGSGVVDHSQSPFPRKGAYYRYLHAPESSEPTQPLEDPGRANKAHEAFPPGTMNATFASAPLRPRGGLRVSHLSGAYGLMYIQHSIYTVHIIQH